MIRTLRTTIALTLLGIVAIGTATTFLLWSPYEVTRMRNSLIAEVGSEADFRWTPADPPAGFLLERSVVPRELAEIAQAALKPRSPFKGNWEYALNIARHLAQGPGVGSGILSNTLDAYRTIMTEKRGYCSDYTQVFNGIALAAGIPVREWGMSFDGFGGNGHAFNEIYDYRLNKWVFIDSFYSFYVTDPQTGTPLSALEFRERLLASNPPQGIAVTPIVPNRFGFTDARHALRYYRRGADQFYLWFGNNVFSYDNHPMVRVLGPWSRALEQGAAILAGIHPHIRIIETESNRELINTLFHERVLFFSGVLILLVLCVALLFQLRAYRRARRPVGVSISGSSARPS